MTAPDMRTLTIAQLLSTVAMATNNTAFRLVLPTGDVTGDEISQIADQMFAVGTAMRTYAMGLRASEGSEGDPNG